jgi:Tol biopolymer transport system component
MSRLAYEADQDTDDVFELYTVTPNGSGNVKVSGTLPADGDVHFFAWSPDSGSLAYLADQRNDELDELFVTSPSNNTSLRISPNLVSGGHVESFKWAPDGMRLAYVADQRTDEAYELFTVRPDGTEAVIVSGNMLPAGWIPAGEYAYDWSSDSEYIVYLADQDLPDVDELFSSTPESSRQNTKLHEDLSDDRDVSRFEVN